MEARPPTARRDSPPGRADTKLAFCKWNRPVLAPNTSFVSRVGGLSPKIEGPGLQNAGLAPLSARRLTKLASGANARPAPLQNSHLVPRATCRPTRRPPTSRPPTIPPGHPIRRPTPSACALPTPQPPSPAARPPAPPCIPARSARVRCRPPAPVPAQWSASSSRTESGILPA